LTRAALPSVLLALLVAALAPPLAGQVVADTAAPVQETTVEPGPTPRGAFLRAVALPAWGHLYINEPVRGGVFFGLQTASYFMLVKTLGKLGEAEERRDLAVGLAADSIRLVMETDTALARRLADPVLFDEAVQAAPRVEAPQALVDSRTRHRQDWLVYTATFTFAAAVDAYVAAHLKGFPDFDITPATDGAVRLRMRFPTGRRR